MQQNGGFRDLDELLEEVAVGGELENEDRDNGEAPATKTTIHRRKHKNVCNYLLTGFFKDFGPIEEKSPERRDRRAAVEDLYFTAKEAEASVLPVGHQ